MRTWVPVPGSAKARLVDAALVAFGARGYGAVSVAELAGEAGVTTGSLYHHFGSKTGIYTAVRDDVEQRTLDRMQGAAAITPAQIGAVLLVGFDYLVREGYMRLLAEPHPDRDTDPIEAFVCAIADHGIPRGRLLLAAWRAALLHAAELRAQGAEVSPVRAALNSVVGEHTRQLATRKTRAPMPGTSPTRSASTATAAASGRSPERA